VKNKKIKSIQINVHKSAVRKTAIIAELCVNIFFTADVVRHDNVNP